jgi:hypothetical protein
MAKGPTFDPEMLTANRIMRLLAKESTQARHRILAYIVDRYLQASMSQGDGATSPLTALLARSVAVAKQQMGERT